MARKNPKGRAPIGKAKRSASRSGSTRSASTGRKGSRKQSKSAAEKILRRGKLRRRPEQPGLPEMEHAGVDKKMDEICQRIGNRHAEMNDLRNDDAADYQLALTRLQKIGRMSYNRFGVEMVRVPGEEKLRVRTSGKGQATAEVDETPEVEAMDVVDDGRDGGMDGSEGDFDSEGVH